MLNRCLFAVGLLASSSVVWSLSNWCDRSQPFSYCGHFSLFGVRVMCGNSRVSCTCFLKRVLCCYSRGFCALLSMGVVLLLSRGVFAWFPIEHVSRCLIRSFNFVTFFVFGVVVFLGFVFVGWYVHSSFWRGLQVMWGGLYWHFEVLCAVWILSGLASNGILLEGPIGRLQDDLNS